MKRYDCTMLGTNEDIFKIGKKDVLYVQMHPVKEMLSKGDIVMGMGDLTTL